MRIEWSTAEPRVARADNFRDAHAGVLVVELDCELERSRVCPERGPHASQWSGIESTSVPSQSKMNPSNSPGGRASSNLPAVGTTEMG